MFENPEFAIVENSRDFVLLNPSSVDQANRGKTVAEEEEESDKLSSDGLNGSDDLVKMTIIKVILVIAVMKAVRTLFYISGFFN